MLLVAALAIVSLAPRGHAGPVGSAFTYQGSLKDNLVNAAGPYDFRFTLYDAASGGAPVSGTVVRDDLGVADGLFTTELDFGASNFKGDQLWLEVEVRQGASTGAYTVLPRQKLTPTPFAMGVSLPHDQAFGSPLSLFRMHNSGSGAGGEFSSSGLRGLRGITASTTFNAAGIRGEAVGGSGNIIGVEGVALNSSGGTGLVGRGLATGAYIEGLGSTATGVYAYGGARGLYAQSLGTGSAVVAVGQGAQKENATIVASNTEATQGMAAYLANNSSFATAHVKNTGTGQVLWLERTSTSPGDFIRCVNATASQFWVDKDGVTHTRVLEILGGADLSERFDVTEEAAIEPGTVVSIDPAHEGRLTLSREPYDRRVAGIISGAGGVQPGLLLGQKGSVADGEHPVALSGRVYCRVTAANGPIRPGDLLTTSAVPGHAMRVEDHARAQGAILGKAMGSLEHGEGLVLVLVGLQ
jgi:hypothetical protein